MEDVFLYIEYNNIGGKKLKKFKIWYIRILKRND